MERKRVDDKKKKQPGFVLRTWGENQSLVIFNHLDLYFSSLVENPQCTLTPDLIHHHGHTHWTDIFTCF